GARLRDLEAKYLSLLLAERDERRAAQRLLDGEREHRSGDRIPEIAGHRVDVGLPPALDTLDDDEPPTSLGSEEPERVTRGHGIDAARGLGGQLVNRLGPETSAKPAKRAEILRPVAAH